MRLLVIVAVTILVCIGCRRTAQSEAVIIRQMVEAETRLANTYFAPDRKRAEAALQSYLDTTSKIELAPEMNEARSMLFRGRGLALARLEFLRASDGQWTADLSGAIGEFREAAPSYASLSDIKLATVLVDFVRGDATQVGWLDQLDAHAEEAFARIERSGKRAQEKE